MHIGEMLYISFAAVAWPMASSKAENMKTEIVTKRREAEIIGGCEN